MCTLPISARLMRCVILTGAIFYPAIALAADLPAPTYPQWWLDHSLSGAQPPAPSNTTAFNAWVAQNYSPVNLGQLKNFAAQAQAYLDSQLAPFGGAGTDINNLINSFGATSSVNYAPANLGQLKNVAKPFYDRLIAVGFDTKSNLNFLMYGNASAGNWTFNSPWPDPPPGPGETGYDSGNYTAWVQLNYAPVNLGQLKLAFSFDFERVVLAPSLWLDAGVGITMNGSNRISLWADTSGLSNNATQATDAAKPLWVDNVINGHPIVRLDGVNGTLAIPSVATGNFTIFLVAKATTTHEIDSESTTGSDGASGQKYILAGPSPGGANASAALSLGTNGVSYYERSASALPPLAVYNGTVGNTTALICLSNQAQSSTLYLNGQLVRVGLTSTANATLAPTEIGLDTAGGFAGDIAELLIYNRALTIQERANVETYLSRKYALNLTPQITISAPVNGANFAASRVDVNGAVTHTLPLQSVTVNGIAGYEPAR